MAGYWEYIRLNPNVKQQQLQNRFVNTARYDFNFAAATVTLRQKWRVRYELAPSGVGVPMATPWTGAEKLAALSEIMAGLAFWSNRSFTLRPMRDRQFKGTSSYWQIADRLAHSGLRLQFRIEPEFGSLDSLAGEWDVVVFKSPVVLKSAQNPALGYLYPVIWNTPTWSHVEYGGPPSWLNRVVLNVQHFSNYAAFAGAPSGPAVPSAMALAAPPTAPNWMPGAGFPGETIAHEFGHTLTVGAPMAPPKRGVSSNAVFYATPDEYLATRDFLVRSGGNYSVANLSTLGTQSTKIFQPSNSLMKTAAPNIRGQHLTPILVNLSLMMPGLWWNVH
jgi:hypothetical protein